jgi:thioredoxin reductase (NADPH)
MADDEAIPNLDAPDIALFEAAGTRRSVVAGDYLYREGDSAYDFYVLVCGGGDRPPDRQR